MTKYTSYITIAWNIANMEFLNNLRKYYIYSKNINL